MEYAHYQCNKIVIDGFYRFTESVYLKYLKYLQSGPKFEPNISNDRGPHVFRSKVVL